MEFHTFFGRFGDIHVKSNEISMQMTVTGRDSTNLGLTHFNLLEISTALKAVEDQGSQRK